MTDSNMKSIIYSKLCRVLISGDVFMNDTKGFLPDSIDMFQKTTDNHAGMILNNHRFYELSSSEAIGRGVTRRSFRHYVFNEKKKYRSISFYRLKTKRSNLKKLGSTLELETILKENITGYDFLNLLFFQVVRLGWYNIFGKKIWIGGGKEKGEKRFICGEWVAYIINKSTGLFPRWWQDAPVDIEKSKDFELIAKIDYNKDGSVKDFHCCFE